MTSHENVEYMYVELSSLIITKFTDQIYRKGKFHFVEFELVI